MAPTGSQGRSEATNGGGDYVWTQDSQLDLHREVRAALKPLIGVRQ